MVLFAFFKEKYCGEKNPVSDGEALVHGSRKRKKGPGIGPFQRSAVHGSSRGGWLSLQSYMPFIYLLIVVLLLTLWCLFSCYVANMVAKDISKATASM